MRKKIGKRIGTVPIALVAVFALAAFISVGLLLALNGGQFVEAQDASCPVLLGTAPAPNPVNDAKCNLTSPGIVKFEGSEATGPTDNVYVWIFARGADIEGGINVRHRPADATTPVDDDMGVLGPPVDAVTYSHIKVEIAPAVAMHVDARGRTVELARSSVEIELSPEGGSEAKLFVYYATSTEANDAPLELTFDHDGDNDSTDRVSKLETIDDNANDSDAIVTVYFVGSPVKKANVNNDAAGATETVSAIAVTAVMEDSATGPTIVVIPEIDATTDMVTTMVESLDSIDSGATSVWIAAEFNDSNLRAVNGSIEFAIGTPSAGAEAVRFAGGGDATRKSFGTNFGAWKVEKLPKDMDVRVPVTATMTSSTGDVLELTGYIMRKGDPTMVDAAAYACTLDTRPNGPDQISEEANADNSALVCVGEIKALTDTNAENDPDEVVAIAPGSMFFISAKSTDSVGNTIRDATKEQDIRWEVTADADNASDAKNAIDGGDRGNTNDVITVNKDAELGTYSITVEDGDASDIVSITVSGKADDIMIDGPDMIPADTGLATYTVKAVDVNDNIPSNATDLNKGEDNTGFTVAVRYKDVQVLGLTGEDTINFSAKTGIGTFRVLMPQDAVEGDSVTITVNGTAGSETLSATKVVMYGEAAPEPMPMPMLLGDPSITSVMSDAAGMATVMLTPGDNADQHWIWALPTDLVSEGMFSDRVAGDATSFTMSGLTSGMSYWFTAVAGRGEKGAEEWSAYSGWSAETPIE